MTRHLISLEDIADTDLRDIVRRAGDHAAGRTRGEQPLRDAIVGVHFRKTSTRTRTAFSAGALRLGGRIIAFGPDDLQLSTGETSQDTGAVFARMLDLLVARTAGDPAELRAWSACGGMSVVNAMTSDEHPTQALADLATLTDRFGRVEGLRVLYVGEGNNTAAALTLALARYPDTHLELRTPWGYGLPAETTEKAAKHAAHSGATIVERHDMDDLPADVDVVYTTRWQTTGTEKVDPLWRERFEPFRVTPDLWTKNPDALFMHDLPAHRGEEVDAAVLDGPRSIAFDQAAFKMYSAMAVLEWCLTPEAAL
ncbi:MAG: ornithine carbamoyltransferase [Catenulispora sp.]|nr:ornithine carbamoyltransferase [Catenulispora sp.]